MNDMKSCSIYQGKAGSGRDDVLMGGGWLPLGHIEQRRDDRVIFV